MLSQYSTFRYLSPGFLAQVFSPHPISSVEVSVDGQPLGLASRALPTDSGDSSSSSSNGGGSGGGGGVLYELPWAASAFASGLHQLSVTAEDVSGSSNSVTLVS